MATTYFTTALARATARIAVSRPLAIAVFLLVGSAYGRAAMAKQWQDIADKKEKYNAYLCSREWSVLKEAVKKRSNGICERCKRSPGDAVHHLTYERKYHERLEDLQHQCNACHAFTHGKSNFDPAAPSPWMTYLTRCRDLQLMPIPFAAQVAPDGIWQESMGAAVMAQCCVWRMLNRLVDNAAEFQVLTPILSQEFSCQFLEEVESRIEEVLSDFEDRMPFSYGLWKRCGEPLPKTYVEYQESLNLFGLAEFAPEKERTDPA